MTLVSKDFKAASLFLGKQEGQHMESTKILKYVTCMAGSLVLSWEWGTPISDTWVWYMRGWLTQIDLSAGHTNKTSSRSCHVQATNPIPDQPIKKLLNISDAVSVSDWAVHEHCLINILAIAVFKAQQTGGADCKQNKKKKEEEEEKHLNMAWSKENYWNSIFILVCVKIHRYQNSQIQKIWSS